MKYTQQLIRKAKVSRCRICYEYISESEADNQEFQACKTIRGGGIALYIPGAGKVKGGYRYEGELLCIANLYRTAGNY